MNEWALTSAERKLGYAEFTLRTRTRFIMLATLLRVVRCAETEGFT